MNHSQSWSEIIGPWVVTFLVFTVILFINIVLATLVGIAVGCLFSLMFIGDWINEGLKATGVSITHGSLYKIGAVAGFLSGFLKYSFSFKR